MRLRDICSQPEVNEPLLWRNLTVFPLQAEERKVLPFIVLDEGLVAGRVQVEELDRASVESVVVRNSADDFLFILEGEEIYGALQNRVFNTSVILDPMGEAVVPVSCVEQGRWSGRGTFSGSTGCSHPSLRAILCSSVTRNLRTRRSFHSDQGRVWSTVSSTLTTLRVRSNTVSLSDAFYELRAELDQFVSEGSELKNYSGFLVATGSRVIGMDIFFDRSLYKKEFEKLLKSYALEGLLYMSTQRGTVAHRKATRFISDVFEGETEKFPSVAKGEEFRVLGRSFVSKLTVLDGKPVHLSAFRTAH